MLPERRGNAVHCGFMRWHPCRMQWHWGNIGSAVAGLSALVIAVAALARSPAALRDWRARQAALAEAAKAQAALADEQREQLILERRAQLNGWSGHGIHTFGVSLVTDQDEAAQAAAELGKYTDYVVLRVSERERGGNGNRARDLRQIIEHEGYISRSPTPGEREALETGVKALVMTEP